MSASRFLRNGFAKSLEIHEIWCDDPVAAPASVETIAEAEKQLGHALPAQLRELYLSFNGFMGPTNAPFLHPLLARPRPGGESLVAYTEFCRGEDYFPDWLQTAVAVGGDGTGMDWFILLNDGEKVVRWDAEWEDYEVVEGNLLDAWLESKNLYDGL